MSIEAQRKPVSGWTQLAAIVAGLVVFAILISLGLWQLRRLEWKEALIATIESRVHAEPVPLAELLRSDKSIADQEYTPVRFSGSFAHQYERHFFATYEGASGYYVYTPLKLAGSLDWIFVNRGFVPFDRKEPSTREQGQVAGDVTVTGLVRPGLTEKPSSIVPDNDPAKNIFYWKDIRQMRETSGLPENEPVLGFFIDADKAPNPGGMPIGGVTMIDLPNSHLQYAMTWFGLAAALAGVLAVWLWRSRRTAID